MNLKEQLKQAIPTLTDDDFAGHATDLYVVAYPEVTQWLKTNYQFWNNVTTFYSQKNSNWNGQGKLCYDIPFAMPILPKKVIAGTVKENPPTIPHS